MMILSFGYTAPALLASVKTVTRRNWAPRHAGLFHAGDLVQAYDRATFLHGKRIGTIRLTADPILEPIATMPDEDYEREGFRWLHEHPEAITPDGRRHFGTFSLDDFRLWRMSGASYYVVRFEVAQ